MAGSSILIVDDVEANLLALEVALAPFERRVVKARSGKEALAALLDQDFALVLLDVAMPIMDGFETARMIRARARNRDLPIIFVTAHDHDAAGIKQAYQLGVVDFLFKPLDSDVVRAKTRVFIAMHERTQELVRLARENEQLALSDRRKTEFLAALAHELRNPLAPIRSAIDVLREAPDRIPPARVIDVLDRQCASVTRLVDDMLDISRVIAGKLSLRLEVLTLDAIIEHAVEECRAAIAERRHTLTSYPPDDVLSVRGDAVRLVQVIVNLLTNAVRYTKPGGKIDVSWRERAGRAYVRVSDNGIGFRPDVVDSLFEMFTQEGVAREQGGLGLGLPLAKRLVELQGGTISATSAGRDQGSTFEIALPIVQQDAQASPPAHQPELRTSARHILIVDDNEDARSLMAAILSLRGHRVTTADDGPSGLVALCARQHDIALVDIGLPGFDGVELVRRAREDCPDLTTKLVAMTGYGQEDDRKRTTKAGFEAHLLKPVTSTEVFEIVDRLCSGR